jgi:uncharacterized membrane protein YedE/YeeE
LVDSTVDNPAMLHSQLPWFLAGPLLGLCVVACRLLLNGRLGVTGGYSEIVGRLTRGSARFDWRGWILIGIVLGGTVAPILVLAGVLIGFGAKLAGGCTSGNGLSGTAMLSRASLAATATFFGTAIVVSFLTRALA